MDEWILGCWNLGGALSLFLGNAVRTWNVIILQKSLHNAYHDVLSSIRFGAESYISMKGILIIWARS
jgi:hypothetical protein